MVFKKKIFNNLTALCLLFIAACNGKPIALEAPANNMYKLNSEFKINLQEEHNSGYTWILNQKSTNEIVSNVNQVWRGNEKGIDFLFETSAIGTCTLEFTKLRYQDTAAQKKFVINVK